MHLTHAYADALPELVTPWRAEATPAPRLLVFNEALGATLDVGPDVGLLTGTSVPPEAHPVAMGYAGHQFGGYSPRLGDGRALLLGELAGPAGGAVDLHLKGSGRTPFSRGGDGLAVVGPMLREYLLSESMHALGIPTTRALAVVATGRRVQREVPRPGAVLARVAASHLRVGTFQYARNLQKGDQDTTDLLQRLVDVAIARHHPDAETPLELFEAVVAAQADLVARWMLVGFVHGVMNTDNTTISGETIDYGPCAFLDAYDPSASFSSIDENARYAFDQQPPILEWNLARLAEAILPLLGDSPPEAIEAATGALRGFRPRYAAAYTSGMRAKLGVAAHVGLDEATFAPLVDDLLRLMGENRLDLTSFFRALGEAARGRREPARSLVLDLAGVDAWLDRWLTLAPDAAAMDAVNPVYVPRNHLVEEALAAAEGGAGDVEGGGDLAPFHRLLEAVTDPFTPRAGLERYAEPAPAGFAEDFRTFCGT